MQNIVYISVDKLFPHPDNPRKNLGDLTELTEAIRAKGVLQNLTVVPADGDNYRIVIGHRRHAAAKLAELTELPCVIADMSPQEQFETMIVENIQRSDLTVYEQAEGFQMMLDMGQSAEQVAQKTGVSATTVRNRVQLLKLNKKKLDKAQERGGTMKDYMKLTAIKDPKRRDRALDAIGTADFNNALKREMEGEELEAFMAKTKAAIEVADWLHKRTAENCGIDGEYAYYRAFDKWNRKELQRPDDADTTDYIWVDSGSTITIYRKKDPDTLTEQNTEKERKKRHKAAMEAISNEAQSIAATHLEMREEFIHDFTKTATYEMDIEAFAAKTMLFLGNPQQYNTILDLDRLGDLIGVKSMAKGYALDQAAWNSQLFNRPLYVLLCTAYTFLEESGHRYVRSAYDSSTQVLYPCHNPDPRLDLIYEGLVSIGYEMSEEEIQMQKGTHPVFQKANNLIAAYKKEDSNG